MNRRLTKDFSLDEFIRKKRPNFGKKMGVAQRLGGLNKRNSAANSLAKMTITVNNQKNVMGRLGTPRAQAAASMHQDARLKIIQKQKFKMKDARDKLNLIARKTDARHKLQKIQNKKISNIPGLSKQNAIQNELAGARRLFTPIADVTSPQKSSAHSQRLANQDFMVVRKQINPNRGKMSFQMSSSLKNASPKKVVVNSSGIVVTTKNENAFKRKMQGFANEDDFGYVSKKQKINLQSNLATGNNVGQLTNRLSANLQARLGASSSEGLSPLQGYKVQVSNLHPIVTQEDIIELFGDVGPLRRAMMLKQGLAEVVFVKIEDAKKAVDTYHNRQLDGQPMACKLLTPVGSRQEPKQYGNLKSSVNASRSTGVSSDSRIMPDISIIHKALFNKRPTAAVSNPNPKDSFMITIS